jgi:hypothetical protein
MPSTQSVHRPPRWSQREESSMAGKLLSPATIKWPTSLIACRSLEISPARLLSRIGRRNGHRSRLTGPVGRLPTRWILASLQSAVTQDPKGDIDVRCCSTESQLPSSSSGRSQVRPRPIHWLDPEFVLRSKRTLRERIVAAVALTGGEPPPSMAHEGTGCCVEALLAMPRVLSTWSNYHRGGRGGNRRATALSRILRTVAQATAHSSITPRESVTADARLPDLATRAPTRKVLQRTFGASTWRPGYPRRPTVSDWLAAVFCPSSVGLNAVSTTAVRGLAGVTGDAFRLAGYRHVGRA